MKYFKNPLSRKEFVNQYGETMVMVMSANTTIWVHHDDCNEDFENLNLFIVKYILNVEEQKAITEFMKECKNIIDNLKINLVD